MEKNEKGWLMMALLPEFRKASDSDLSRYNGGWVKSVESIDKARDNGYSLIGDFVDAPDSLKWRVPGLYIDCDISGSRKNNVKFYRLFRLNPDGSIEMLGEPIRGASDWAVRFWPLIEEALNPAPTDEDPRRILCQGLDMLLEEFGREVFMSVVTAYTKNLEEIA